MENSKKDLEALKQENEEILKSLRSFTLNKEQINEATVKREGVLQKIKEATRQVSLKEQEAKDDQFTVDYYRNWSSERVNMIAETKNKIEGLKPKVTELIKSNLEKRMAQI